MTTTTISEDSIELPSFSHTDDSEYHESIPSTPRPSYHEKPEQSHLSGMVEVDDSGTRDGGPNHHVIDQYSWLSDASDVVASRNFETNPTPDHQQGTEYSFLPDATEFSNTTIKMEDSHTLAPGYGSPLPDANEVEIAGLNKSVSSYFTFNRYILFYI